MRHIVGACDGMAVDAGGRFEDAAAFGGGRIDSHRLQLLLCPLPEARGGVDVNAKEHHGVLSAAILRALAEKEAGLVGLDPHLVGMIRNEVGFCRPSRGTQKLVVGIG